MDQILSQHLAAVRCAPSKNGCADRRRYTTKNDCVLDAERPQDLWKLSDVTELVGHVARPRAVSRRGGTPLLCARHPPLEIAIDALPRHEKLVGQCVERANRQAAGFNQRANLGLTLGAYGEIVVEHDCLAIEMEVSESGLVGESVQHSVNKIDELVTKDGERLVPFPIPMAVG